MDRRNALFALCVLVLYACDDKSGYCKKKGCSHDDDDQRSSWGSNELKAGGSVVYEGTSFVSLTMISNGIDVRDTSSVEVDAEDESLDAGVDASEAGTDASDASVPYDAGTYTPYPSYPPPSYYDTSKRMEIRFVTPTEIGAHRLEDTSAFAIVCPRGRGLEYGTETCVDRKGDRSLGPSKIRLVGTLEVLDIHSDEMTSGAPTDRPYELPWGWHMVTTNEDLRIDVRVESKPTWNEYKSYCD